LTLDPKRLRRPDVLPHFERIKIQPALAIGAVARIISRLAICRDHKATLVLDSIDGITQVFGLAPAAVRSFPAYEQVVAAITRMTIGGEIQTLIIGMNERRTLITCGIDHGTQIYGAAPPAIQQPVAHIDITAAIAVRLTAGKIQIPLVGRNDGADSQNS